MTKAEFVPTKVSLTQAEAKSVECKLLQKVSAVSIGGILTLYKRHDIVGESVPFLHHALCLQPLLTRGVDHNSLHAYTKIADPRKDTGRGYVFPKPCNRCDLVIFKTKAAGLLFCPILEEHVASEVESGTIPYPLTQAAIDANKHKKYPR